jgi:hypothetical protein
VNDESKRSSMEVQDSFDKREVEELLALCQAAAEMWEHDFDVVAEIQQMRAERDEQIWPMKRWDNKP